MPPVTSVIDRPAEGIHVCGAWAGFAPLGAVLVALLGIGIAEGSGLIGAAMRLLVSKAPKRLLTFVIVFSVFQLDRGRIFCCRKAPAR